MKLEADLNTALTAIVTCPVYNTIGPQDNDNAEPTAPMVFFTVESLNFLGQDLCGTITDNATLNVEVDCYGNTRTEAETLMSDIIKQLPAQVPQGKCLNAFIDYNTESRLWLASINYEFTNQDLTT